MQKSIGKYALWGIPISCYSYLLYFSWFYKDNYATNGMKFGKLNFQIYISVYLNESKLNLHVMYHVIMSITRERVKVI